MLPCRRRSLDASSSSSSSSSSSVPFILLSCWVLLLLMTNTIDTATALSNNIRYRPGKPSDEAIIAWKQPLSILKNSFNFVFNGDNTNDSSSSSSSSMSGNYLVAEIYTQQQQKVVGWGQIRKLSSKGGGRRRDPQRYDARPGSYDLEQDVDDQMLDEFVEDPNIQVPSGWASLPWSPEYRAMERSIQEREARRVELVREAKAEMKKMEVPLWELTSLYVDPEYRGQGIGKGLVEQLCDEYRSTGKRMSDLYLITKNTRLDFFQGFEIVKNTNDIPEQLTLTADSVCLRGVDDDKGTD